MALVSAVVIFHSVQPDGTPGLPAHHQLAELAQTHVRWVLPAGNMKQPQVCMGPLAPASPTARRLPPRQAVTGPQSEPPRPPSTGGLVTHVVCALPGCSLLCPTISSSSHSAQLGQ